ncbi:Sugar phosphate isomerase/epimerase [Anaerosphaera aminiphila DSM 21120]|uniref:Sugar phosphate isomerase/epimerase n=1 Tax=Anaerosphaera aminiphila DSM 21120 TaxID=1120995 RepID=A0A1M5QTB4_9FIRM|nr:sugar phosphate isomerase/epimerase [Anaerosphaera aminiphila]SHH16843.1 Sugar phosphate isomerase/epimerase [Anaerosphaera aminiphila DSM 21120]
MGRLLTLMTAQWADLELEEICSKAKEFGYDGLELACWGNHLDPKRAAEDDEYVAEVKELLNKYDLKCVALCTHIIGQCVGDYNDPRLNGFAPPELADKPDEIRAWAIESMKYSAIAAKKMGCYVVTGFVGSPIWKYLYSFPQTSEELVESGFQEIYDLWTPILDVFVENGIKFALEVHPGEIAFDYYSTKRLLEKFKDRPEFGLNFDPSHLVWQGITPHVFLEDFIDRVYHVHMKDAAVTLDGRSGLLGSHIDFGDLRRGWNFRSLGHGDVDFENIIRVLNAYDYQGPLSVEWEDSGMEREYGAREAAEFVRKIDFKASDFSFDSAMASK